MTGRPIETVAGGDFRRWSLAARARQMRHLLSARLSHRMGWPAPPGEPPVAWSPLLVPLLGEASAEWDVGADVFGVLDKALRNSRRGAIDTPMTRLIAREMAGSAPPKTPPPALPGTGWLLLGEMAFGVPDFIFWLKHRILDDLCAHSLAAPPDGDIPPLDAQDVWMALVIDAAIDNEGLTPALLPRLREGLGKASLGFWPQYLGLEMLVRSGIKLSALPGDLAHELKGWSLINAERYKIGLSPGMLTAEGDQGSVLGRRLTRADIPEWHRHLLPVEIIAPREDAGDEPALQVPPVQQDKSIADIDAMPRRAGPAKGWMGQGAPPADLDSLPQTRQSDKNTRRK